MYCANCGWQNDASARMCGGCGAPLRIPGQPEPVAAAPAPMPGVSPAIPTPSGVYAQNAPTTFTPPSETPMQAPGQSPYIANMPVGQPPYAPGASMPGQAYYAPPAGMAPQPYGPPMGTMERPYSPGAVGAWPGAVAAPVATATKPRGQRKRALIITGAVLAALIIGLIAAWALIVQPALHKTADSQIRNALSSIVNDVPGDIAPGTYYVTQGEVNQQLQQLLPSDSPIKNLQAQFVNGDIVFSYSFLGGTGTVTATPYLVNQRVQVHNTRVSGLLSTVESGNQLESAFNSALNGVPGQGKVTGFSVEPDRLVLTVGG